MKIDLKEHQNLAGFTGAASLLAGLIRYLLQNEWNWLSITLAIIGLALLAVFFFFRLRQSNTRTAKLGVNTSLMSVAVIAILVVINLAGYYKHKRVDMTANQYYTISDQTRKILSGLKKDVKIIKFGKIDDGLLRDRARDFRDVSSHVSYEFVDPEKHPEVIQQYKLRGANDLPTIVTSGERVERLTATDEQALVNVILKLTQDKLKTVCFVTGHEEKSITGVDEDGYALVDRVLKGENYETKSINLTEASQVPSECDVLAIPGPKKTFLPQETSAVGKYLDEGGKVFLLTDPESDAGLGDVLKAWNIQLGADTVVDPTNGAGLPVVKNFPDHAITKDMKRSAAYFPFARSVKSSGGGGHAEPTTEILVTSPRSWAETDLKNGSAKFDEGKDTQGPISIGVAVSKKIGDKEARLVVYGDSDFATNTHIPNLSNGDLFFNTVNWLAQDEQLISIRSKDPAKRKIDVDDVGRRMIMIITTMAMPLGAIIAGFYIWSERR